MRLSVPILTCDRFELTKITVESFIKHNGREHDMYYGDDASVDVRVHEFMESLGIPSLVRNKTRRGCSPTTAELFHRIVERTDNAFLLHLQNDFETVRPIPWDIVEKIFEDDQVGWVRLYGTHEAPGGRPCGNTHGGRRRPNQAQVKWSPLVIDGEPLERGDIHWCYHPTITRQAFATELTKGVTKAHTTMINSARIGKLTVRFMDNITHHLARHGKGSTPGGIFYS